MMGYDWHGRRAATGRWIASGLVAAAMATAAPPDATALTVHLLISESSVERVEKFHSAPARRAGNRAARGIFGAWPFIPVCPVSRFGLGDAIWDSDDPSVRYTYPVGYSNVQGGGRPRCREGLSRSYVTRLKFPIEAIPDSWRIESATLQFKETKLDTEGDASSLDYYCPTATDVVEFNPEPMGGSNRRGTGRRTVDEHRLYSEDSEAWIPLTQELPDRVADGEFEMDVTLWVSIWHNWDTPNHGLSFYGRDYRLRKNNKSCVAAIAWSTVRIVLELEERE